jgi:hypothetical protein
MRKHPENLEVAKPVETTSKVVDFHKTTTEQMKFFLTWGKNVKEIPDNERKSLVIYEIKKEQKDPTEYYVTLNEQEQLVASNGKSGFLLEGRTWDVPNSTLEVLNKPAAKAK